MCLGPEKRDLTLLSRNHNYYANSHWKILLLFMATQISISVDCLGFVWIWYLTLNCRFWKFPLSLRNITLGNWILKRWQQIMLSIPFRYKIGLKSFILWKLYTVGVSECKCTPNGSEAYGSHMKGNKKRFLLLYIWDSEMREKLQGKHKKVVIYSFHLNRRGYCQGKIIFSLKIILCNLHKPTNSYSET